MDELAKKALRAFTVPTLKMRVVQVSLVVILLVVALATTAYFVFFKSESAASLTRAATDTYDFAEEVLAKAQERQQMEHDQAEGIRTGDQALGILYGENWAATRTADTLKEIRTLTSKS